MHIKSYRQRRLFITLLLVLVLLTACAQRNTEDYLDDLSNEFTGRGFSCAWQTLPSQSEVPFFTDVVWYQFIVNGEKMLVYFDSSNRAKQLAEQFVSSEKFGFVSYYGLRYILVYAGQDKSILKLLAQWKEGTVLP